MTTKYYYKVLPKFWKFYNVLDNPGYGDNDNIIWRLVSKKRLMYEEARLDGTSTYPSHTVPGRNYVISWMVNSKNKKDAVFAKVAPILGSTNVKETAVTCVCNKYAQFLIFAFVF